MTVPSALVSLNRVTGRYAQARRIKGEPGVDEGKLDKVVMDAIYKTHGEP